MRTILLFAFCFLSTFAYTQNTNESFMGEKWDKLYAIVNKEIDTINKVTNPPLSLKYRLFELHSEKMSLVKQKENKVFLEASPQDKSKNVKESYFKTSLRMYQEIKNNGLTLLDLDTSKRFSGQILYTLALNSRDYGNDNKTEEYLLKTLSTSKNDYKLTHNARISLAEYYYNEKEYQKAQSYYELILQKNDDDWRTKHLLNSAWCLFKLRNYDRAISNIQEANELSKNPKFVDVQAQVLETAATFYVFSGRINEGMKFFLQHVNAPIPYLQRMISMSSSQGNFEGSHLLISETIAYAQKNNQNDALLETYLIALDIYREHKKDQLFLTTSQSIVKEAAKKPLPEVLANQAEEKIKSFVGFLQISFTKNGKVNNTNYSRPQLELIIAYFEMLKRIKPRSKHLYTFYQGETFYSVSLYEDGLKSYLQAIEIYKKENTNDNETLIKIFNSIFGTLEKTSSQPNYVKNMEFSYDAYLSFFPKGEHSENIYTKLFNIYFDQGRLVIAQDLIDKFNTYYPAKIEMQQKQTTRIVDKLIDQKNTDRLNDYIVKFESGYLAFPKTYTDSATNVLGNLLFEKFQKLDQQGKKVEAANGYISLFTNPKYPQSIKSKSSLFAAVVFLELTNTTEAFKWIVEHFNNTSRAELLKNSDKFYYISIKLQEMQAQQLSYKLSDLFFQSYCKDQYKEKLELAKNSAYLSQLLKEKSAQKASEQIGNCLANETERTQIDKIILSYLIDKNMWSEAFSFVEKQHIDESLLTFLINEAYNMYWNYIITDTKKASSLLDKIKTITASKPNISNKQYIAIDNYQEYAKNFSAFNSVQLPSSAKWDEELFNKQLEGKFLILKKITEKGVEYIKSGIPEITLQTSLELSKIYHNFANQLTDYTPQGVPSEFAKSFKDQMSTIASTLYKKRDEFIATAKNLQHQKLLITSANKSLYPNISIFQNDELISSELFLINRKISERSTK